ncbi:zinc-binding dehydrogenase [Pseudonocardia xishanensis]|uniref:Zn-dependent alcohol dehydrogenase n=1 Tax=Pseudonocardia xishanensis TaxID=630995 RepID=A0ABP8RVN7_9PSEU
MSGTTVKGVVVQAEGEAPEVLELVLPEVGPRDVRVELTGAGLCHSDLSMLNGTLRPVFPLVLGHEAAGTVVEAGAGVSQVGVGDRVVINWAPACRRCWFCLRGEQWLCAESAPVASVPRGTLLDGTPLNVAMRIGAFAEQTVLPESAVVKLPTGIPDPVAALLGCAVLTGMGAVRNTADVRSGDTVLVLGLGGVGLSAVAGAALAGAARVIAADLHPEKEELARAMGATDFLVSGPSLTKDVRRLTGGIGADHALECVGSSRTIRAAWDATRRGGRAVVVGAGRVTDTLEFNAMELFGSARTLTSSVYGSSEPGRDIADIGALVAAGRLDLGPLVTHHTDLLGIGDALDRMASGEGGRTLITTH